jgi:hypothetical protein
MPCIKFPKACAALEKNVELFSCPVCEILDQNRVGTLQILKAF